MTAALLDHGPVAVAATASLASWGYLWISEGIGRVFANIKFFPRPPCLTPLLPNQCPGLCLEANCWISRRVCFRQLHSAQVGAELLQARTKPLTSMQPPAPLLLFLAHTCSAEPAAEPERSGQLLNITWRAAFWHQARDKEGVLWRVPHKLTFFFFFSVMIWLSCLIEVKKIV